MSAFKQKFARLGATAGVLASATAILLAVGSVGASSASAACTTTIKGQGSSLQKIAQTEIWNKSYEASTNCTGATNAKPEYTSTSSGKGLAAWGYTGGSLNTEYAYIGSDDGPSATQISAGETAAHGSHAVIVPVAQTAIAIVVHPPTGCTLPTITNEKLEQAFSGAATTWEAIGGVGTCTGSLKRVVRAEGSGTTYQFKAYLAKINTGAPCAASPTTWTNLEAIEAEEKPNITWPECGSGAPTTAAGGGALATAVKNTAGTIGYVALPDALNAGATTTEVQNGGSGSKIKYAAPNIGTGEAAEANCVNAEYTNPTGALTSGVSVNWSTTFGGNPTIGGTNYPICTLTYDLGWTSYTTAGFGSSIGSFVKHYYEWILSNKFGTGNKRGYQVLPSKTGEEEKHNVQKAAEKAVSNIG